MTKPFSRRQLLYSAGLTAGTCLAGGCSDSIQSPLSAKAIGAENQRTNDSVNTPVESIHRWQYKKLDPAIVAAEAYRQVPDGGCMYGLVAGIMKVMAREQGEPFESFPLHMMKYGEGGVGLWGSLCGTVNGGAAIFGLFEQDKPRRESLIAELFSWYETAELPAYLPESSDDSLEIPKSVAGSVLCHVSVGKWGKMSGNEIGSPEMKERCRRLTADVAAKTVELLNANLREPCKFAGLSAEVKSCLSCHGKDYHDTMGKMECNDCHQNLLKKRPLCPGARPNSTDKTKDSAP